jgi:hypothetical protein
VIPRTLIAVLPLLFAFRCLAQPVTCTANVGAVPELRAEGRADYAGDVVLTCTGGTPTGSGISLPFMNLSMFLTTNVGSRLLAPNWSEALLIVDEPGGPINPATPQLMCGAAGTFEGPPGVCTITGTGTGVGTYNGSGARANVFQARQTSGNLLQWTIPFDPPPTGGTRYIRLTNVRADVFALGASMPPVSVLGEIAISGPLPITLVNAIDTVGFALTSLNVSVPSAPTLPRCTATNAALFANPAANGAPNLSVQIQENFATAFKVRSGAAFVSPDVSPAPTAQLVPGFVTNNETDFYNPGFPVIAGRGDLSRAGLADEGTRFLVSFSGVPSGVALFIQTTANMTKVADGTPSGGVVRLVTTAADGSGAFAPTPGNTFGIAPVALAGGAGQAVFEVMNADPFNREQVNIPVYVAFTHAGHGTAMVATSYAAVTTVSGSSLTAPIPRFANTGVPLTAFDLPHPCH